MANDASMIFRIKGDASHVKRELSTLGVSASRTVGTLGKGLTGALQGNFSALSGGISSVTGGLSMLGPKGMIAGAAISAVAGAATAATGALFALTKEAAAYGSQISDLTDKTGLGAEALTSLDYAAKISGSSIDDVGTAVTKFNKLVGEAAQGSDEAVKKLEQFGLTPREAMEDLQGSLGKVFKRIQALPTVQQRTTAAMDAFGKSGAKLLPVIATMNGDFDGLIAKAKELGVTFDDAAAQEMDKFDDMLVQVGTQFDGLKRTIGIEFLPMFMEMATEFSNFIKENKEDLKSLASDFSGFVRLTMKGLKEIAQFIKENQTVWNMIKGLMPAVGAASAVLTLGRGFNQAAPAISSGGNAEQSDKRIKEIEGEIEQEVQLREAAETRRLKAIRETQRMEVDAAREGYQQRYRDLLNSYKIGEITTDEFKKREARNISTLQATLLTVLARQRAMDLTNTEITLQEKYNLEMKYQQDVAAVQEEGFQSARKVADMVLQSDKLAAERRIAIARGSYDTMQRNIADALNKQILQEKIAYEKGLQNAKQTAENIARLQKNAISAQITDLDRLIEALRQEGATREEIATAEQELARLRRQQDVLTPLERELEKLQQIKAEKQELRDLEHELQAAMFDAQQQALQYRIEDLENAIAKGVSSKIEKEMLLELTRLRQEAAQLTLQRRLKELEDEKQAALERVKDKENEEKQKAAIEDLYRVRREIAEKEFQQRLKAIREQGEQGATATTGGFFGSFNKWLQEGRKSLDNFQGVMAGFGDILFKAFMQIQEGLAAALEQWVLTGETGPAVMKKILAATLATMAKDMALKAMYYTALGFGLLAIKDFQGAGKAFTAAALFGGGAAAAAFAGRALAGDNFKKESNRESVSGRQSNNTGTQGQAFSSMQDQTVDVNRADSFGSIRNETVLVVKDKSGMFSKLFQVEMEKNSRVRQTIMRTA
jgi:hypothetical protein